MISKQRLVRSKLQMCSLLLFIAWYSGLLPRRLSKEMDDQVHNNGQQNADYDTGCYGEEELEVPFLH